MDHLNERMLDEIIHQAETQVADIAEMLVVIRDQVAPMIPTEDLAQASIRHSVRHRISPHPALRRATFAGEAAKASLRRARDCAAAAKVMLQDEDEGQDGASGLAPRVRQAEARHWAGLVHELGQTVARAWAAVTRETERAVSGKATLADLPAPSSSAGFGI